VQATEVWNGNGQGQALGGDLVASARGVAEIAALHAEDVDTRARFPLEAADALKAEGLLGAPAPRRLGGRGASMTELASVCETLAQQCAATGMIYAMHCIQVACIARHASGRSFFEGYLEDLVESRRLVASVTSEVGVGGEMRTSVAAVARKGGRLSLTKDATTISYGATADDLLVTARRDPAAAASDQVLVLLRRGDFKLEPKGAWNSMGMRGTCSPGFLVTAEAPEEQILPVAFAEIASQTMVPFSHILWSSCWLGIATAAVARARAFVREQARAKPGTVPPTAQRLAEVASDLQLMRTNVHDLARECDRLMERDHDVGVLSSVAFALRMNNVKVATSELVVRIVLQALRICGIAGYKNDSRYALGRHLRDACSAALMVGNDRILAANASMLLVLKED
jgi:acyl-CoA dehydrogenase